MNGNKKIRPTWLAPVAVLLGCYFAVAANQLSGVEIIPGDNVPKPFPSDPPPSTPLPNPMDSPIPLGTDAPKGACTVTATIFDPWIIKKVYAGSAKVTQAVSTTLSVKGWVLNGISLGDDVTKAECETLAKAKLLEYSKKEKATVKMEYETNFPRNEQVYSRCAVPFAEAFYKWKTGWFTSETVNMLAENSNAPMTTAEMDLRCTPRVP